MQKEQIKELFERFEKARYLLEGVECWSARDLQLVFNYSEWRNFTKVIDKARESCQNAGIPVSDHFVDVNKMVVLGSGSKRQVADVALTRYACYLIAQNGERLPPSEDVKKVKRRLDAEEKKDRRKNEKEILTIA